MTEPYFDSEMVQDCADLEQCDVWEEKKVRARKTHRCQECGHPIIPGELYWWTNCLYDDRWSTTHTCVCCYAARCAVAEAYSRGEYTACVVHGELWSVVEEGLRDGWLTEDQVGKPEIKR